MAVFRALKRTPDALVRNPVLFVPVLVLMLLQFPQFLVQAVDPLLASLVSLVMTGVFIVAMPFFQGGIIGMADEALRGKTSLASFVQSGTEHFVSLIAVYLLLFAANFVLGIVGAIAAIALGAGILASGADGVGLGLGLLAVVGLVFALSAFVYLLVGFFVQFYAQAIVVDDFGALDGLKHSVSVVRTNLVSTLGYTVFFVILAGTLGVGVGLVSLLTSPAATSSGAPELSLTVALVLGLLLTVFGTLFGGFFAVFSVAFYREIRPATDASPSSPAAPTSATDATTGP